MNRTLLLRFFVVFIINILSSLLSAQAQTICDSVFFKEFSINGNLEPYATKQLSNGEILVAGKSAPPASSFYKAMAVKFSTSGDILWSFQTGGAVDDRFTGAIELSDSSYILYGITTSFGYTQGRILLVRVSSTGSILWSRQLGTSGTGTEQIKSLMQFSDGDLVGTFNINDSTSQSDPVVFKIGLDGTLRWARRFDNGREESFTSIAYEGNKIYVSGFYTAGKKRGVLTQLNSSDGTLLTSLNIYHNDNTYDEEVNQLEIINNRLSYGLRMRKDTAGSIFHRIILIQSDLTGTNKTFETIISNDDDTTNFIYKRTRENGFVFLRSRYSPEIIKLNMYNQIEWSTMQSAYSNNGQQNFGMDITPSGGTVSAGYYKNFLTGNLNKMALMKTNPMGKIGGCTQFGSTFFTDTVTQRQAPFAWNSSSLIVPDINQSLSLTRFNLAVQSTNICNTEYCTDTIALPAACNKTLLTEYTSNESLILRDAVTTSDGGRVGVGTMQYNGWLVKFKNNGAIDWSKQVDEFSHNHDFLRVIRSSDNNILAFANNYYVIDHGAYRTVKVVKLDNNGTILFTKELIRNYFTEIADVAATPDGGFVVILNQSYGSGYLYSHVLRYDASFSVVWKKEIKHSVLTPIYRSLYCNQNGVWFGHDSYDNYNLETIGIQKLDYATGNDVWKKRFLYTNTVMRFNRIMVSADTVYAFAYKIDPQGSPIQMIMLKLKDDGSVINSLLLQTDPLLLPNTYNYIDLVRPTVTLTPQNDFVMSNQVLANAAKALNISRFDKAGVARWSRNYTRMDQHTVFNIHPQGTGILVLGTVSKPNSYNAFNSDAFMLKVDSMGVIINGATGVCAFENRTLLPQPYPVTEIDPRIDSVVNLTEFLMDSNPVLSLLKTTNASLYCHEQSSCTPVNLAQNGSGCNLQDTLVFYLTNNSCGVSVNWLYDTTYFTLVHISADTLKLAQKRIGTSMVKAEVEDDCSLRVLSIPVSVLIAASSVNLGADTVICPQGTILLSGGPGYHTYRWNDNSTDSILTIKAPGLYYVTVTDFCGGTGTDSILVSPAGADFMITGIPEKCNADTVTLQATVGYINYIWSPVSYINAIVNVAQVYPPATMEYYIQAEKFPGCIVRDTFQVKVNSSPPVFIGNDTTICYNKSLQLTASSGFIGYLWNTGATANNITVTDPAMYTIQAFYVNNCISKDTVQLRKHPFAFPNLGNDTTICSNTIYQLKPGNYAQYLWSTTSTSSSIGIGQAGILWVKVTDLNGCTGTDTIKVLSKECLKGFFMPNAFTPNKDGKNDILKPILLGNLKKYQFWVYNQWGQVVFTTTELTKGWDGEFKGQTQDTQVFVWKCVYQFEGEIQQNKKGTVVLIR
jgi:gliding motility-associated-like protein